MFDGDSIECSSDTPEDLGIENDFLIDIKVGCSLLFFVFFTSVFMGRFMIKRF
jgi:hypothetical protein